MMSLDLAAPRWGAPFLARAALVLALTAAPRSEAESNFVGDRSISWASNFGWLEWSADLMTGVEVGQYVCAGYIYSPNVGWIHLGNGSPQDGIQYQNRAASDFGVNVDSVGNLRGFAYGANIGWVHFEAQGAPRVDLTTGRLTGFAYGANVGWLSLGDADFPLAVESIAPGSDSDRDGIPDAWELLYAGELALLDSGSDLDQDGQTDLAEYLADTNPLDDQDRLAVVRVSLAESNSAVALSWTSKSTRQYQLQWRDGLDASQPWRDAGLGPQLADGPVTTRTAPATAILGFFRIRAFRPLAP